MPHQFRIFSQSDYLIQIVDINSHTYWQTVQIQIRIQLIWIYTVKQDISGFSRTRVNLKLSAKSECLASGRLLVQSQLYYVTSDIALVKAFFFFQSKSIDIFLISPRKQYCGYSLEAPRRGASNEYPQHMFSWRKKNIYRIPSLI